MSLNLAVKGGLVLVGGAGTVTGSYFVYSHISSQSQKPKTFKRKIEALGKSLISNNYAQWDVKVTIYGKTDNSQKIRINNEEKSSVNRDELKTWCFQNLELSDSKENNTLFPLVEKWCVTPTIKEALSKETKAIIPFGDPIDEKWQSKINGKTSEVKSELIDILKLTVTAGSQNTVAPETLRNWCKENIEKEYVSETENNYPLSKNWCLEA